MTLLLLFDAARQEKVNQKLPLTGTNFEVVQRKWSGGRVEMSS